MGLGRHLLRFLIERAKKAVFRRVFVLTAAAHDWFEALGFAESPVESLPLCKCKVYDQARKRKVFALELNEGDR
jgi:amino-acid N-acetyltransferase